MPQVSSVARRMNSASVQRSLGTTRSFSSFACTCSSMTFAFASRGYRSSFHGGSTATRETPTWPR
jgi:hypothetical protein